MGPKSITLTQLQTQIRGAVQTAFAVPVWVSAEVAELKVNASGHCYLELVEKSPTTQSPVSQARATIWRGVYQKIVRRFETEAGQRLAAGMRILAEVSVTYHELYGFSLNISDIDPTFTLGEVERQRQLTIAQLKKEGVWEMNRELELPPLIQRIAVISSAQAAGYQDFMNELGRFAYRFETTLFDAVMQGEASEESIIAALGEIVDRYEDFDVVVLIRGGGSAVDLGCFDSYLLCAHVAQFPLPIVTGIGHDKDVSVADMVAHLSLKTPTAVASWLVERMAGLEAGLERAATTLHDAVSKLLIAHKSRLDLLRAELTHQTTLLLTRHTDRLRAAAELVESRHPRHILQLGFAIARCDGAAIKSTSDVHPGDTLQITLSDGTIETTVK